MSCAFSIPVDLPTSTVTLNLSGFIHENCSGEFAQARRAAFDQLCCGPGHYSCLLDLSECNILPQSSIPVFEQMLAEPAKRTAVVTVNALARLQVRRLMGGRTDVPIFSEVQTARAWLQGSHELVGVSP